MTLHDKSPDADFARHAVEMAVVEAGNESMGRFDLQSAAYEVMHQRIAEVKVAP